MASPGAFTGASPLETLVAQNCLLLQGLWQNQGSDLAILGGGSASGGSDGGAAGARGAAALEVQRRQVEERPLAVTASVRAMLARSLGSDPASPQDALEFLRRHGAFLKNVDIAYLATMLAEIWNLLETSQVDLAHARVGLALAAADQAARDNRWEAAEPSPEALSRPPPRSVLRPHSPLVEPRWMAAAQAYIRDSAAVGAALRRKGKGKGKDEKDE